MITQKLILVLLLLLSVFQKPGSNVADLQDESNRSFSPPVEITLLRDTVKKAGWTPDLINRYEAYIINLPLEKLLPEKDFITSLKPGFEKNYFFSLTARKDRSYQLMFDSLFVYMDSSVSYLPYYEQLVFSASATKGLRLIETKIENSDITNKKYFPFVLSLISSARGEYETALNHLKTLADNDTSSIEIYFQYLNIYRHLGDYNKAYSYINTLLTKSRGDEVSIMKTRLAEGTLLFLSDRIRESEKLYRKVNSIAVKNGSTLFEAKSLISVGICDDMNNKIESARVNFSNAAELAKKIGDEETQALAYSELGVSYTYTNHLVEAKNYYEQSYDLFRKTGNKHRLSLLSDNIGKIHIAMYDYKSALKFYEQGLELAAENKRARILNLTGLADIYANLSNYSKALKYYRKAREIAQEINEVSLNAEIDKGLGSLNFNLNKYSNALQYFMSASERSEKAHNVFLSADIYQKLGLVYLNLDSLALSEKYLKMSLDISRKIGDPYTEINSGLTLAYLYIKSKRSESAAEYLNKARKVASSYGFEYELVECDLLEGEIKKAANDFEGMTVSYKNALARAKNLNEFNLMIEANYKLALTYDKNNLKELAESYYLSAVKLVEDRSRPLFEDNEVQISYFSSKHDLFSSFADFYLKHNQFKNAFELIEKSRSRNTMQNLSNLKIQASINDEVLLKSIYEYDWMLHSGLYDRNQIDSISILYSALKNRIIQNDSSLKKYLNFKAGMSLDEIQQNFGERENLVSIFSSTENTFAFILSKNGFNYRALNISRTELRKLITTVSPYFDPKKSSGTYYNQDLFSFNVEAAYTFYNKIIKPFINIIPEGEKIIFTSSNELEAFPFEFLVTDYNKDKSAYNYSGQKYLLYRNSISYSPSASVYIEQKNNTLQNNDELLIVGNPAIKNNTEGFAERRGLLEESPGLPRNIALLPLQYSEEEVSQIDEVISADEVLLDNKATETNFKETAEFTKLIHLSTHSFLFNKQPVIFFSNSFDAFNDGFLEASEIVQMKLNSDLVVLSSCISGLGTVDESEGILGMTKAFFEAGSKSVVVSLWDVNDKYTSKLMGLFYKRMSDGYDKSEALRLAKIDFIKEYSPNPYYWGAFVLAGNTGVLTLRSTTDIYPYLIGLALTIVLILLFMVAKKEIKRERA